MARGPKKHLKRVAAPSNWMLDKLTGIYAPRPSSGPHKLRECIPLAILLRNRLKFALTYQEVKYIVMQRLIKVDGKVRTDTCFPLGLMDVITIDRINKNMRIMYDTKGRFVPVQVSSKEAQYKLCKVTRVALGPKGVPTATTNDARTLRYIHPEIRANDTVKIDLETGKVMEFIKCEVGNLCTVTGGRSQGRVGVITHLERKQGAQCIVSVRDKKGHTFATLIKNIFVLGEGDKSLVTLPKDKGIRLSNVEDRALRMQKNKN
ncbi:40S ribosomal protein S4, putative [Cryptosporidium muris RN66]|uniref:40S ribosomal protein S4 n=1 Tax=Cryptosporidium muris (strain RN66) TaxID=441375 RepID=B6AF50_CRYMR|nr:40S ribosomal protein S4, putative [Cryptosporidium muris RN66]EEA06817.1 40S ribosomal protein S4, putative [Cryptosporidium muris RN66]|eukprot:XP_002141166.1 40S ribosomal protein S4 [Cryptosporidium muris RN66]